MELIILLNIFGAAIAGIILLLFKNDKFRNAFINFRFTKNNFDKS